MKKKYICMVIMSSLLIGSVSLAFAGTNTNLAASATESKNISLATTISGTAVKTSGTAIVTTGAAVTTSNTAITTSQAAITTSDSAVQGVATPQKTETKKLSLADAIKIMKTTGARAETAELNKKADMALGKGYAEDVSTINRKQKQLDTLELKSQYPSFPVWISAGEIAYNAQVAGVTSNNKKISELRMTFANENIENNYTADMLQIEQDTINLYYTVLLAQDNYKIAQDNLSTQQKTLKNTEAKKRVGLLSKKDVLLAQSAVTEAESEVRTAENNLKTAKMSFNFLLGYNVLQDVTFTDTLQESALEPTDVETAVKKALASRNEIKGADFAIKVYELLLKDVADYPKSSSAYLNAQINLLEAQKTARDARSQIEIDLRNKYNTVQEKKAAVVAAKNLKSYADEGARLMGITTEEGLSTIEDLLKTQVSQYKANLNLAKANKEYILALKAYEDAQGTGTMRLPL